MSKPRLGQHSPVSVHFQFSLPRGPITIPPQSYLSLMPLLIGSHLATPSAHLTAEDLISLHCGTLASDASPSTEHREDRRALTRDCRGVLLARSFLPPSSDFPGLENKTRRHGISTNFTSVFLRVRRQDWIDRSLLPCGLHLLCRI